MILLYALANGLARKVVEVIRPPLQARIIEQVQPPPPPAKPAPPDFKPPPKPLHKPMARPAAPPPSFVPLPEVQVPVQAPTITAVTPVPSAQPAGPVGQGQPGGVGTGPAAPAAAAPAAQVRKPPVVRADSCETPSYPAASLRAGETGTVTLSFLIDVTGKVLESKVERSSGHRRLDEAARSALELCKFIPGSVDGKPERAWARMQYEWKID